MDSMLLACVLDVLLRLGRWAFPVAIAVALFVCPVAVLAFLMVGVVAAILLKDH